MDWENWTPVSASIPVFSIFKDKISDLCSAIYFDRFFLPYSVEMLLIFPFCLSRAIGINTFSPFLFTISVIRTTEFLLRSLPFKIIIGFRISSDNL